MSNILQDKRAIFQVIGCLLQKPTLLGEGDKYNLNNEDFPERFHKIIFAAVNNLFNQGVEKIDFIAVDNFLASYPVQHKIFTDNDGIEYLQNAIDSSEISNYKFYYDRVKKFSLLRALEINGFDIDTIYPGETSVVETNKNKLKLQEFFDMATLDELIDEVDKKLLEVKEQFLLSVGSYGQQAGEGMLDLIERLKEEPEVGMPLQGGIMNTMTRGARLRKLYMRSAPTGVGKTRLGAADAINMACNRIYDTDLNKWIKNGTAEATLFITTELEMDEIQTLFLAFISGVNEDNILNGEYEEGEEERIREAARIISNAPIWIEHLPNFGIKDVEGVIKRYNLKHNVQYIFFDYIHTTLKILEEIANQSKGMKLREDNVLLMFVTKLKDLANELGVFIYTSTQVNGSWEDKETANQNMLRGAKAMADKLDVGIIALAPTKADLEALKPLLENSFLPEPNLVYHMYKARRSKYKSTKLWMYADLGTCRVQNLFLTDNDYKPITVTALEIEVKEEQKQIESGNKTIDF